MALTAAGSRLTAAHRQAQVQLATDVAKVVRAAWPLLDLTDLDASQRRWLAAVVPILMDGRLRSANLSAAYLRAFARAEIGADSPVVLARVAEADRAAAEMSLTVTGPVAVKALTGNGFAPGAAAASALGGVLGASVRHVLNGSRDTARLTVAADPQAAGWSRAISARACDFCRILAGRGAVYAADSADFAAHDHCGCNAEPAYGEGHSVKAYAPSQRTSTPADRARVREWVATNLATA